MSRCVDRMNSEVFIAHDTVVQYKYEELEVNRLKQTSLNRFKNRIQN